MSHGLADIQGPSRRSLFIPSSIASLSALWEHELILDWWEGNRGIKYEVSYGLCDHDFFQKDSQSQSPADLMTVRCDWMSQQLWDSQLIVNLYMQVPVFEDLSDSGHSGSWPVSKKVVSPILEPLSCTLLLHFFSLFSHTLPILGVSVCRLTLLRFLAAPWAQVHLNWLCAVSQSASSLGQSFPICNRGTILHSWGCCEH